MIDIESLIEQLPGIAEQQRTNAENYMKFRVLSSDAETALDALLATNAARLTGDRKSISKENLILLLMATNDKAREYYDEYKQNEASYKGLEKVLEAGAQQIMAIQSAMKYYGDGGRWGGVGK